jgi:hypothetical protein
MLGLSAVQSSFAELFGDALRFIPQVLVTGTR